MRRQIRVNLFIQQVTRFIKRSSGGGRPRGRIQNVCRMNPGLTSMIKLNFSLGAIDQLWIDGALPSMLREKKDNNVKVQLSGKSDAPFPPAIVPVGDLLRSERPSPLQHAVTLLLAYPHSIIPAPAVKDDSGWWTMPGSTRYGQIRIPLTAEAIAQIRAIDGDGYDYELVLEGVELANKTPK
jgi:hypothetical protein